jgi:hypothetical protein
LPDEATCSFSDSAVVPGSGEVTSTMTVETGAPGKSLVSAGFRGARSAVAWAGLLVLAALAVLSPAHSKGKIKPSRRGARMLLAVAAVLLLMTVACGDDETTAPTGGTPSGTHEFTVTGAWNSVERSAGATLVVE